MIRRRYPISASGITDALWMMILKLRNIIWRLHTVLFSGWRIFHWIVITIRRIWKTAGLRFNVMLTNIRWRKIFILPMWKLFISLMPHGSWIWVLNTIVWTFVWIMMWTKGEKRVVGRSVRTTFCPVWIWNTILPPNRPSAWEPAKHTPYRNPKKFLPIAMLEWTLIARVMKSYNHPITITLIWSGISILLRQNLFRWPPFISI